MKKQVKVYKGYVPKGEKIKDTISESWNNIKNFGMYSSKRNCRFDFSNDVIVKRTITITSEDEEVT